MATTYNAIQKINPDASEFIQNSPEENRYDTEEMPIIATLLYNDLICHIKEREHYYHIPYNQKFERSNKIQSTSYTYKVPVHADVYICVKMNDQHIATAYVIYCGPDGDEVCSVHQFDKNPDLAVIQQRELYNKVYNTNFAKEWIQ